MALQQITAGYTAYTGHAFTETEAAAYNLACSDAAKLGEIRRRPNSGDEIAAAHERALDRQHRMFCTIVNGGS